MAIIELYRGLRNNSERTLIEKNNTAGGKEADVNALPPSAEELDKFNKGQKATDGECFPPPPNKVILTEFTEYTSNPALARSFARRSGYMAVIKIDAKYVHRLSNDRLESGYVIRSNAPLVSLLIETVEKGYGRINII